MKTQPTGRNALISNDAAVSYGVYIDETPDADGTPTYAVELQEGPMYLDGLRALHSLIGEVIYTARIEAVAAAASQIALDRRLTVQSVLAEADESEDPAAFTAAVLRRFQEKEAGL